MKIVQFLVPARPDVHTKVPNEPALRWKSGCIEGAGSERRRETRRQGGVEEQSDDNMQPLSEATHEFAKAFHNVLITNVMCVGAGVVGTSTMAIMAKQMPDVSFTIFDDNPAVICSCQAGTLHFYEPGIRELVESCHNKNLRFSPAFADCVRQAQVIFVCINTPPKTSGVGKGRAADLSGWSPAPNPRKPAQKIKTQGGRNIMQQATLGTKPVTLSVIGQTLYSCTR